MAIQYNPQREERMHPEIEDKINTGQSLHHGNAALPDGYIDQNASKTFNKNVEQIRTTTGKPNADEAYEDVRTIRKQIQAIEQPVAQQLEQLAIQIVEEQMGMQHGDVDWDVKLGTREDIDPSQFQFENKDEKPEIPTLNFGDQMVKQFDEEDIKKEVDKQRIINSFTQGAAQKAKNMFFFAQQELNQISPQLVQLYKQYIPLTQYRYWTKGDPAETPAIGGAMSLEQEGEEEEEEQKIKITATATTFVVLLAEMTKGVMEVFALHNLPLDRDIIPHVKKQTESLQNERWDIRLGQDYWGKLLTAMDVTDPRKRAQIYTEIVKLPAEEFNALIKGVLSGDQQAKQKIQEMGEDLATESSLVKANKRLAAELLSTDQAGGTKIPVLFLYALYCAEAVLPIFEEKFPEEGNERRKALEIAKEFLKNPIDTRKARGGVQDAAASYLGKRSKAYNDYYYKHTTMGVPKDQWEPIVFVVQSGYMACSSIDGALFSEDTEQYKISLRNATNAVEWAKEAAKRANKQINFDALFEKAKEDVTPIKISDWGIQDDKDFVGVIINNLGNPSNIKEEDEQYPDSESQKQFQNIVNGNPKQNPKQPKNNDLKFNNVPTQENVEQSRKELIDEYLDDLNKARAEGNQEKIDKINRMLQYLSTESSLKLSTLDKPNVGEVYRLTNSPELLDSIGYRHNAGNLYVIVEGFKRLDRGVFAELRFADAEYKDKNYLFRIPIENWRDYLTKLTDVTSSLSWDLPDISFLENVTKRLSDPNGEYVVWVLFKGLNPKKFYFVNGKNSGKDNISIYKDEAIKFTKGNADYVLNCVKSIYPNDESGIEKFDETNNNLNIEASKMERNQEVVAALIAEASRVKAYDNYDGDAALADRDKNIFDYLQMTMSNAGNKVTQGDLSKQLSEKFNMTPEEADQKINDFRMQRAAGSNFVKQYLPKSRMAADISDSVSPMGWENGESKKDQPDGAGAPLPPNQNLQNEQPTQKAPADANVLYDSNQDSGPQFQTTVNPKDKSVTVKFVDSPEEQALNQAIGAPPQGQPGQAPPAVPALGGSAKPNTPVTPNGELSDKETPVSF
jgi:hypothetical protein